MNIANNFLKQVNVNSNSIGNKLKHIQQNISKNTDNDLNNNNNNLVGNKPFLTQTTTNQQNIHIDPILYNALKDTNDALKEEISRLIQIENKYYELEKQTKNDLDDYKTQCERHEIENRKLLDYKQKYENLEADFNRYEKELSIKDEKLLSIDKLLKKNKLLKEKCEELSKNKSEYENKLDVFRSKEVLLEKLNKSLEYELNELKVINVNSELQEQKLKSIEKANQILQDELNSLRNYQSNELKSLNNKINQLSEENGEIKVEKEQLYTQLNEYETCMSNYENEINNLQELNAKSKQIYEQTFNDFCKYKQAYEELEKKFSNETKNKSNNESIEKRLFELDEENVNVKVQLEESSRLLQKELTISNDLNEQLIESRMKYANALNQIEELNYFIENEKRERQELRQENDDLLENIKMLTNKLSAEIELNVQLKNELNSNEGKSLDAENNNEYLEQNLYDSKRQIDTLSEQLTNALASLQFKEQECKNLERLYDYEKKRTDSLLLKIEELTQINSQLSLELNESHAKTTELELNFKEIIESKKITETNNDLTIIDIKKKQDELKKLQYIHECTKKENMNTIEFLEEKIKDLEKKTELQSLKHEEISLELELMRAKKEHRLVTPLCPHCSSQTISLYHSQQFHTKTHQSHLTTKLVHNVECQTLMCGINNPAIKKDDKDCNTDSIAKIVMKDQSFNVNLLSYDPSIPKLDKDTQSESTCIYSDSKHFDVCLCKYSYNPLEQSPNENPDAELPLTIGDHIFILSELDEDGFYVGQLLDGRRGLVPSNFIEKIKNLNKESLKELLTNEIEKQVNKMVKQEETHAFVSKTMIDSFIQSNTLTKSSSNIPAPLNLRIEKCINDSIIVKWDPANINTTEVTYQVFLNHESFQIVKHNQACFVTIEKIDLNIPNRISVQSSTQTGSSKPQECTLLFGPLSHYAPSNLKVYSLTQTSAILSWWPSSSSNTHKILINNIEHRTLRAGVYRFKLSGLQPDTTHLVTVTMQIQNGPQIMCDNCSANVEFHTLPIPPPVNLRLQQTSNADVHTLIWQPITQLNDTNIASGYSIYIDNKLIIKIKDPNESTANLNTLLLSNAKRITIRTLSADGTCESKDSSPVVLNNINAEVSQCQHKIINDFSSKLEHVKQVPLSAANHVSPKKKLIEKPQISIIPLNSLMPIEMNHENMEKSSEMNNRAENNLKRGMKQPDNSTNDFDSMPSDAVVTSIEQQPKSPSMKPRRPLSEHVSNQSTRIHTSPNKSIQSKNKDTIDNDASHTSNLQFNSSTSSTNTNHIIENNRPKFVNNEKTTNHSSIQVANAKLNQSTPASLNKVDHQSHLISKRKSLKKSKQAYNEVANDSGSESCTTTTNSTSHLSHSSKTHHKPQNNNQLEQKQQSQQSQITLKSKERIFIALYSYNPLTMSPNRDTCQEELEFAEGQMIKIIGDLDSDGFFYGESHGKSGYIPCNLISEIQVDDPIIINQLLSDMNSSTKISTKSKGSK